MERCLLQEVSKASLLARVTSKKVKPTYFPNFFGILPVTTLKWETLSGEKGAPVMAEVISYDASAPLKTRTVVNKKSGDIPKTSISRALNEGEYQKYKALKSAAGSDASKQAILDIVFNDVDFCYNGVRARMEWLAMQALSQGSITLDTDNSAGIVTETAVSFGIPTANKFGFTDHGGKAWSDKSSAPTVAFDDIASAARENGDTLNYAIMDLVTFNRMKATADMQAALKAYVNVQGKFAVTINVINEYMEANMLPKIVVIDPTVTFEDEDHKRTTLKCWAPGKVAFVSDLKVGDIQHGPIMAEDIPEYGKVATSIKKDFVFVSKYTELNPVKQMTLAEANAFPVLNDPTSIYLFDSENGTWS
jgi:hypothetical protein